MLNSIFISMLFLTLVLDGKLNLTVAPAEATRVLRNAELKRAPWPQFSMIASLEVTNSKGNSKSSEYKVYFKDEIKTVVGFLKPDFERGNLLLMVDQDLWFYVKNTRRPTRITPIQKLSGSVSYGDLARLSWTHDYAIESFEEIDTDEGGAQYLFKLKSKSKAATYNSIHLWVDRSSDRPVRSEVFLLSGKHLKTIQYSTFEQIGGKDMNTVVEYTDHLKKDENSVLKFLEVKAEKNIPERYFIRTSLSGLADEIVY